MKNPGIALKRLRLAGLFALAIGLVLMLAPVGPVSTPATSNASSTDVSTDGATDTLMTGWDDARPNDPDDPQVPASSEVESRVARGEAVTINVAVLQPDGSVQIDTRPAVGPQEATEKITAAASEPGVVAADVAAPVQALDGDPYRQVVKAGTKTEVGQYGLDMLCTDEVASTDWNPAVPVQYRCDGRHTHQYATGAGQVIAVLDTPLDSAHPDLSANLLGSVSCLSALCAPATYTATSAGEHGTHVAGIAAAVSDNGMGVAGQAKDASVLPVAVLDKGGYGSTTAVARGITYATTAGADVINLSLGFFVADTTVAAAVNAAVSKGVVVVAAAGNDGATAKPTYPAAYPNVIGVGALDETFGAWSGSSRGYWVDVVAPGANQILAPVPSQSICRDASGAVLMSGYCYLRGTSMATPFISGIVAQILEADPSLSPAGVWALLTGTARDMGTSGRDDTFGYGFVNPVAALRQVTLTSPGAPRDVQVTPGDGQLAVAFSPPDSDGGAFVSNYEYSLDAGATWRTRSPASWASPLVITGLTNTVQYRVALRAVNDVGPGASSAVVLATPVATPPTPTPSPSATPTPSPRATPTPTPSPSPSATPTPSPSATPTPSPSATPTPEPTSTQEPAGLGYRAVVPARLADTRGLGTVDGEGPPVGAVGAGEVVDVVVVGRGGVPASGVGAVAVNVTATGATVGTFLTAWPTGEAMPNASSLNPSAGSTVPNMAIVKVGVDGSISVFNAKGQTHVIVDVLGWFPEGADYTAVSPARFADTRAGQPTVDGLGPKGAAGPGGTVVVPVVGRGGVPASGVGAVAVNVTATGATVGTFLTAWPTGEAMPNASSLNPSAGSTVPNMAIVKVGVDGSISVFNAKGQTHVIVDVLGWFPAA